MKAKQGIKAWNKVQVAAIRAFVKAQEYGKRVANFMGDNPAMAVAALGVLVLLLGNVASATVNTALAGSIEAEFSETASGIVCPIIKIVTGPVVRFLSLIFLLGAIYWALNQDSRQAKGTAITVAIVVVLANTFGTWQQLITRKPASTLCPGLFQ